MPHTVPVTELTIDTDPAELGLDKDRLKRIDAHFARYVEDGRLAGWLLTIGRHGHLAHVARCGSRDLEAGLPVTDDTLWRIYSMTKPITSVAAMILYEEGRLALTDPVSAFIPAFEDVRVYDGGSDQKQVTVPAAEPVRVWHLLTHTAGLTYGFHRVHPVDALYRAAGFEWGTPPGTDLAQACDIWATIPLLFQPGAEWNYSVATDVLGRVVEVASGQQLDDFLELVRGAGVELIADVRANPRSRYPQFNRSALAGTMKAAGVDSGAQIRVGGEGNAGPFGGPRGDLLVSTRVGEHPFFQRKGDNVHCDVPISVWEALLGARIRVPTPSGEAVLVVPPGTAGGQVFRLRGQGLPRLTGDLYVTVRVEVPTGLDARTHELVRELARLMPVETRTALERYRGGAE